MKKLLLSVFLSLMLAIGAMAQYEDHIVADGTEVNERVPVYGYYCDAYLRSQMIYPSYMLAGANISAGYLIGGLEFFTTSQSANVTFGAADFVVLIGETEEVVFPDPDYYDNSSFDTVYTGSLSIENQKMTINFSRPYAYNGGNIIIEVQNLVKGSYSQSYFYGVNRQYAAVSGFAYDSFENVIAGTVNQHFTPKVNFLMRESCPRPRNLSLIDFTDNSATISWYAEEAQNNFVVAYGTGTDPEQMSTIETTSASAELTGLTPLTTYNVYVKAICSETDQSQWSNVFTFSTIQVPMVVDASNPYYEDFEGSSDIVLTNGTMTNRWIVGEAVNNGGSKSLYISNDNGTTNTYDNGSATMVYASRLFSLNVDIYRYAYDWRAVGESSWDFLRVALVPADVLLAAGATMPDGFTKESLPSGWIALDGGLQLAQSNSWQSVVGDVNIETAGNYHLVFAWCNDGSGGNNPPAAIDNISFFLPSCTSPLNVSANRISNNSAVINWTLGNESQNNFVVAYGTGTDPEQMTTIEATTNSVTLTGLQTSTVYNVYVKAICSASDQSFWSVKRSFRTECDPVSSLPYTMGFESDEGTVVGNSGNKYVDYIPCWNKYNDATGIGSVVAYPYACVNYFNTHTGTRCLYFFQTTQTNYAENQIAILPRVNTTEFPINTLRLKFWAIKSSSNNVGTLVVGVMTDPQDPSSFVEVETIAPTTGFKEYSIPFYMYAGNGAYVAIKCDRPAVDIDQSMYVDDVTLESMPSCVEPVDLVASEVSGFRAIIGWDYIDDTQNNFVVAYGTGSDPEQMATVEATTNSAVLTGLTPETTYNVFVKAICSASDQSDWSNPCTFTTTVSCPKPINVIASNLTITSATLSWTALDPDQNNFVVAYGTRRYVEELTTVEEVNTNSIELTGLAMGTTYWVYVKAVCSDEDSSVWSDAYKFSTVYTLDYLEDFSFYSDVPDSWIDGTGLLSDVYNGASISNGSDWDVNISGLGIPSAHLINYVHGRYIKDWVISPNIYLDVNSKLSFTLALSAFYGNEAADESGTDDKFAVLISTDDGATWTESNTLAVWDNAGSERVYNDIATHGEQVEFILSGYTGQTVRLAFYVESTESNAHNNLHIDNVKVEAIKYTITATTDEHGTISPNGDVEVYEGNDQAFRIEANEGYHVASVMVDGEEAIAQLVDSVYTFENVTANHTIDANFEISSYNLTIHYLYADNAIANIDSVKIVVYGAEYSVASPEIEGYTPDSAVVSGTMPAHDVEVTVTYTINTYTITATAGENGTIAPEGESVVNYGDSKSFTIEANEGYRIASVLVDDVDTTAYVENGVFTFENITASHTIAATFELIPTYTITAAAGEHGTITPAGDSVVVEGATVVYTITPDENYQIDVVTVDGADATAEVVEGVYTFANIDANHTISVTFAPVTSVEIMEAGSIATYPNPNNGMFNIDFSNIEGEATYQLVDVKGAMIDSREINVMNGETMNFNYDLRPGTYFVRIITSDNVYVEQIVVR